MFRAPEQLDMFNEGLLRLTDHHRRAAINEYQRECARLGIRPDGDSDENLRLKIAVQRRYDGRF